MILTAEICRELLRQCVLLTFEALLKSSLISSSDEGTGRPLRYKECFAARGARSLGPFASSSVFSLTSDFSSTFSNFFKSSLSSLEPLVWGAEDSFFALITGLTFLSSLLIGVLGLPLVVAEIVDLPPFGAGDLDVAGSAALSALPKLP